ncbi:MAG: hypothetical protein BJ554DRAFT_1190 [Olpidium bornovanus]|uniref:Secreted protein n=1 Tax=Olpidium bornovanus TaxID=278681 RepID=A0A8H7ZS10_9FUNG|nr:MAG: hypothetical protein BJ554DRAFT_1190 [Olpidium bornovanus]
MAATPPPVTAALAGLTRVTAFSVVLPLLGATRDERAPLCDNGAMRRASTPPLTTPGWRTTADVFSIAARRSRKPSPGKLAKYLRSPHASGCDGDGQHDCRTGTDLSGLWPYRSQPPLPRSAVLPPQKLLQPLLHAVLQTCREVVSSTIQPRIQNPMLRLTLDPETEDPNHRSDQVCRSNPYVSD